MLIFYKNRPLEFVHTAKNESIQKKKCIGRLTAGKKRANIQLSNETIHFQEAMDKLHRNYDLFLKTNKVSGRKFQVIQRRAY